MQYSYNRQSRQERLCLSLMEDKNTEEIEGINVHIFYTSNKRIWDYIPQFASFNRFTSSPMTNY